MHRSEQHASHRRAQVVAPGQRVAVARRQGEHPLSDWYLGPDVIHKVRTGHAELHMEQ